MREGQGTCPGRRFRQAGGRRPFSCTGRKLAPVEIVPFDAPLGAEMRGLDASLPVGAADAEALCRALDEHLVLLARGQRLDDPALMAFSRVFGELDPPGPNPYGAPFLPEFPEINVISNVVENGRPIGNLGAGEGGLARGHDLCRKAAQGRAPLCAGGAGRRGRHLFRQPVRCVGCACGRGQGPDRAAERAPLGHLFP